MEDISPEFSVLTAEQEITLPAIPSDAGSTVVGGFLASPTTLTAPAGQTVAGTIVSVGQALLGQFIYGQTIVAGQPVCVLPYSTTVIAFDTKTSGDQTGTTITQSFTVGANSNRCLVVWCLTQSPAVVLNSVKYNGVSMTNVISEAVNGYNLLFMWYLNAPATGANNLVFTSASSQEIAYNIYSYYNVNQSGQPEAQTGASGQNTSAVVVPLTNGALVVGAISLNAVGESTSGNALTNNIITNGVKIESGDTGNLYPPVSSSISDSGSASITGKIVASLAPVSTSLTSRVYIASSLISITSSTYVGIANDTGIQIGTIGNVVIAGVNANQSGLTAGTNYYLGDTAGTFSASPGTVTRKAGIGLSATVICVTNLW